MRASDLFRFAVGSLGGHRLRTALSLLGMAIGVWVDDQDHIWVIHRGAATLHANERALDLKVGECCTAAPPVVVYDQAGNVVRAWGGPGAG